MNIADKFSKIKQTILLFGGLGLFFFTDLLFAAQSAGDVAGQITSSFEGITKLVTGGCYVAGLAFAVTAILQFKQHKDNPQQVPIGKPISLVFIAAALLFMPSVLGVAGFTMFEGDADVSGPSGKVFTKPT